MKSYQLTQVPLAKAEMLIRKSVAEVFEAFINPAITTKFWFTKGSGRLESDKQNKRSIQRKDLRWSSPA